MKTCLSPLVVVVSPFVLLTQLQVWSREHSCYLPSYTVLVELHYIKDVLFFPKLSLDFAQKRGWMEVNSLPSAAGCLPVQPDSHTQEPYDGH